jgi:hypothetical protein
VTCKQNKAVALNVRSTKKFFEENGVVALLADKDTMPEVNPLLKDLGNSLAAIPYYAIYAPGLDQPIHFGGNVLTPGKVREEVQKALDAAAKFKADQSADQSAALQAAGPASAQR